MEQESESIRAIRDWMGHPVTQAIWARLTEKAEDSNERVHDAVRKADFQEATRWEAFTDAVNELIRLPVEMIEEKKENAA